MTPEKAQALLAGTPERRAMTEMTLQDAIAEVQRVTPEMLRRLLDYDPGTGRLFWVARSAELFRATAGRSAEHACANWNARYAGTEAFTSVDRDGYRHGSVFNRNIFAHRVVWAIVNDSFPTAEIDHIDGDPGNNRLANLRAASRSENVCNQRIRSDNTSGHKGVSWKKDRQVWEAHIGVNGKRKRLGGFSTKELAAAAYAEASAKNHGAFGRIT